MKLIDKSMLENIITSLLYKEYINFILANRMPYCSIEKMNGDTLIFCVILANQCIRHITIAYGNEEHEYWTVVDRTPFGNIYLDIYPDWTAIRNEMNVIDPVILEDYSDKLIRKINCYVKLYMVKHKDDTDENSVEKDDD